MEIKEEAAKAVIFPQMADFNGAEVYRGVVVDSLSFFSADTVCILGKGTPGSSLEKMTHDLMMKTSKKIRTSTITEIC